MACSTCKGYRWFDDRGFVACGQPAFSFTPCSECNPKGDREMWGNEIGDDSYVPHKDDHRMQVILNRPPLDDPEGVGTA